MVLESTVICFDNSDFQRNGDYFPSRLSVQKEAVNLICLKKFRTNPENNVCLMTISNPVNVLCSLTTDSGRIYSKLNEIQPKGNINLITGIRIAHLVLKHRQGKNHKMRVVVFVGSPINETDDEMQKLAKRLKKEKVSIDFVCFGGYRNNDNLLEAFINTLNGRNGTVGTSSHLISISRGTEFAIQLFASPIIQGEDGIDGLGLSAQGYEFGFDPNEDPELALALRLSMEEQRAHEEQQRLTQISAGQELRRGNLSHANTDNINASNPSVENSSGSISNQINNGNPNFANMTEEEQIAFAIQMSMQEPNNSSTDNELMSMDNDNEIDYEDLEEVIRNLPGVDQQSNNNDKKNNDHEDQNNA